MKPKQNRRSPPKTLKFTPTAWAKLLFLRDLGETEVGGFGISAADELLLIEDFQLVKQTCTWAHVAFDDDAVADFFDDQVDQGRQPEEFARVWIHTHPGECPLPSSTDEATFTRVFGNATWAVMFILARGGQSYARLRANVGPGIETLLPVEIDYSQEFEGCDFATWEHEYDQCVQIEKIQPRRSLNRFLGSPFEEQPADEFQDAWLEYACQTHLDEEVA